MSETFRFNAKNFGLDLLNWLKENRSNFEVVNYAEVSELVFDSKSGNVTTVRTIGKNQGFDCDAVVICAGANTATLVKKNFGIKLPILPCKTYTFDMPCEYDNFAFIFDDYNFTAVGLGDGLARVQTNGDLCGNDQSYDKKRIRNCLNRIAKTLDVGDVMKNTNMKACLVSLSPDDLPLVGFLRSYPNVYINAGHGVRASSLSLACGKQLADQIQNGDQGII